MASVFGEERDELRRVLRRFFTDRSDEAQVRRLAETEDGYDKAVWEQLTGQLGLAGLAVPEEYGGSGFSQVEMAIVAEEAGRALLGGPWLSSAVLAANLLLECGGDTARELLPEVCAGGVLATAAFAETSRGWDPGTVRLAAERRDGGWRLSGEKFYVLDGGIADVLLVTAATPAGVSVFAVRKGAAGLAVSPMRTMDHTRRLSGIVLADTPAELLGEEGAALPALERTLDLVSLALAAEDVGGALRLVEMSAEYARTREQFGKPIGGFQAIKQKLADMLMSAELAKAAVYRVAELAGTDPAAAAAEASMAKALCSDTFVRIAYDTIQVHGGIGFTWEHPAHLYFRRAKSNAALFGTPDEHRELVARRMGI
ncbi:acyl-CoA dehydrogenase family protein [Amycolatopsis sp.]|uniref:acyl-CoA dehydrogenase family protein n=1 Tax=Amycolatopsis sp. TaxID=37632 RepID=UPI002CA5A91C|nr:acyl-CoA dehydrogenase family protein [Amycolatopsis sp.]HVV09296.1 acyl-CoA dehydrogenase family protein [Amycolatopsis sp.]